MSPGVGEVGAVLRAVAEWREASIAVREAMEQRASERNAAQDRMYAAYDALCALSPAHLRALAAQADAGAGLRVAVQEYFAAEQEYADLESITRHDVLSDAAWEAHNALADEAARRESDAYKRLHALAQASAGGEGGE